MQKALVTGASGFIGSLLVEKLAQTGFEVCALMRSTSSDRNLKGLKFTRVEGHLGDIQSLREAVKGVDYVFHLAGVVAAKNTEEYFEHNTRGTQRLIQAVAENRPQLKRFVYVSSLAASGPAGSKTPLRESDQPNPVSDYGRSKLEAERALLSYSKQLPITIIRPPMVYGPKDQGVFILIKSVARGLIPVIRANNSENQKYYSMIHGVDLVEGIVKAATTEVKSGEIFYLAHPQFRTQSEIFQAISLHLGKKSRSLTVPHALVKFLGHATSMISRLTGTAYAFNKDKVNELLPDYWICSSEKARNALAFQPRYDLDQGMKETVQWYREQNWL